MIRIEIEHSKIVYRAFFFKIINYEKMEFAKNSWKNKYETFLLLKNLKLKWYNFFNDHDKNCSQIAIHFKVDRKQAGKLGIIETPTFIILFILLLLF